MCREILHHSNLKHLGRFVPIRAFWALQLFINDLTKTDEAMK
jgi:hypothetical protein